MTRASSELAAVIRSRKRADVDKAVENHTREREATMNDAAFSRTPFPHTSTAERCPSHSLMNVARSSGGRRVIPSGVAGARLKCINKLTTVTPQPARNHGNAGRSSTLDLRKSESTAT